MHQESRAKFWATLVALMLGSWFLTFDSSWATESPMYTLSAKVTESQPDQATFKAHFDHPATGENIEYLFQVTERTGMNGLKGVRELKPNDVLQIDYFKTANGSLIVEYMARVKMSGAPEGLEKFNPADLLKKQ